MIIKDFADILAWQKAQAFAVAVINKLGKDENVTLRYEIIKSVLAIPSMIAAWFERRGLGDFKEYMYLAKAKVSEVRTFLFVAKDIWEITQTVFDDLLNQATDVSKLIYWFVKTFIDKKKKVETQDIVI